MCSDGSVGLGSGWEKSALGDKTCKPSDAEDEREFEQKEKGRPDAVTGGVQVGSHGLEQLQDQGGTTLGEERVDIHGEDLGSSKSGLSN